MRKPGGPDFPQACAELEREASGPRPLCRHVLVRHGRYPDPARTLLVCREPAFLVAWAAWGETGDRGVPYQASHVRVCAWHAPAEVNEYVTWGPMMFRDGDGWRQSDLEPPLADAQALWARWRETFAGQVRALGRPAPVPAGDWEGEPARWPTDGSVSAISLVALMSGSAVPYGIGMLYPELGRERVEEIYRATPPHFRDSVVETYTLRPAQDWPTTAGYEHWRERGAAPPVDLDWDWIPGARAVVPEVGFYQAAYFERDWS